MRAKQGSFPPSAICMLFFSLAAGGHDCRCLPGRGRMGGRLCPLLTGTIAMKIATRPSLRRLLALDRMLREERYPNAPTAAAALEVHPHTIHRDLEFLRDSWGAPLEFSRA